MNLKLTFYSTFNILVNKHRNIKKYIYLYFGSIQYLQEAEQVINVHLYVAKSYKYTKYQQNRVAQHRE